RCRYQTGYERSPKFWCREGALVGGWGCSKRRHIVETDGSEAEVTRGRVSIRDNHTQRVFTVTLDNLTRADAGTYHCGVVRTGLDPRAAVEVTVSPGHRQRQCNQLLLPRQNLLPSPPLLRKGNPASPLTRTPLPLSEYQCSSQCHLWVCLHCSWVRAPSLGTHTCDRGACENVLKIAVQTLEPGLSSSHLTPRRDDSTYHRF
uniref:Ig-like domain-containing protein n=1 Tax=Chrysemys picta bellii TaxID=8478 RepID=A0A8C3H8L7_CHRPI